MRSLNSLAPLRKFLAAARGAWLARTAGADIHPSTSVSLSCTMIGGPPGSIVIGETTLVAFKTLLIARNPDGSVSPIHIGARCFIGGGSTILPGVTIGDGSVIAAGSIVANDIPPRCVAGGNPARILREDVDVLPYGRFPEAAKNQAKYWSENAPPQPTRRKVFSFLLVVSLFLLDIKGMTENHIIFSDGASSQTQRHNSIDLPHDDRGDRILIRKIAPNSLDGDHSGAMI